MFMSKAQPRATKEYYPPHLTGRGSRGLMALAFVLFALGKVDHISHFRHLDLEDRVKPISSKIELIN